jgi:hypothetical protein
VFAAKPGFVSTVRLKAPKVIDRGRQTRAIEQVARGVPHDGDEFAVSARLYAQNAETVHGIAR